MTEAATFFKQLCSSRRCYRPAVRPRDNNCDDCWIELFQCEECSGDIRDCSGMCHLKDELTFVMLHPLGHFINQDEVTYGIKRCPSGCGQPAYACICSLNDLSRNHADEFFAAAARADFLATLNQSIDGYWS